MRREGLALAMLTSLLTLPVALDGIFAADDGRSTSLSLMHSNAGIFCCEVCSIDKWHLLKAASFGALV